jgi:hypothetical protein
VVAEAALHVVGLAVDVAADRATHADLTSAGQHRQPQAEREQRAHQCVERDAGLDLDGRRVGVHPVDAVQRGHVDHDAARVLRRVAIASPESACDHPAPGPARHVRTGLAHHRGDRVDVGRAHHVRGARCGPSPAGEPGQLVMSWLHRTEGTGRPIAVRRGP